MNLPPIITIRNEYDGKEITINLNHVVYCGPKYEGGYRIFLTDKFEIELDWKDYNRFKKTLEKIYE